MSETKKDDDQAVDADKEHPVAVRVDQLARATQQELPGVDCGVCRSNGYACLYHWATHAD